jgi:hypothetical protein
MEVQIKGFQKKGVLGLVQFATDKKDTFEYISSGEAMKHNFIEVTEISEGGSVNSLGVINNSDKFVFFHDGDILIGAKQNRTLNTSVLLAPNIKTILPVSCVEAGRWGYKSRKFTGSDYSTPAFMRSTKTKDVYSSLSSSDEYSSNQRKVWKDVSDYMDDYKVLSATSDYSDVYESRRISIDDFLRNFKMENDSNGLAIFIKKEMLNLEVFNRTEIYKEYFPKLLRGAAIDAFRLKDSGDPFEQAEADYKTLNFFDNFDNHKFTLHKGVGAGEEKRFETKEITGFELSYNEHLIHLASLCLKKFEP